MRIPVLLAAAGLAALPAFLASAAPTDDAIDGAVRFIVSTQEPDGGFGGFGAGQTFDAVYAIRAAGIDPAAVTNGGTSPADFLAAQAPAIASGDSAALAAKAALAATALGLDPEDVAGTDLVAATTRHYDAATGRYAADDFSQGLAIVGLSCTGTDVPGAALDALIDTQLDDGGWGFQGASDPDTTAVAVQALIAASFSAADPDVASALEYLRATQGNDAGWGFDPNASNAASTAYVMQALFAAGEDVNGATYTKNGQTPTGFLLTQRLDDGSFAGFDPAFAAMQVVPALAGRTLCNAPETAITQAPPTATPTASPTATTTATPTTTATATTTATTTATVTATASLTATPAAPRTGSGGDAGNATAPWLLLSAGLALALGSVGLLGVRRR